MAFRDAAKSEEEEEREGDQRRHDAQNASFFSLLARTP